MRKRIMTKKIEPTRRFGLTRRAVDKGGGRKWPRVEDVTAKRNGITVVISNSCQLLNVERYDFTLSHCL